MLKDERITGGILAAAIEVHRELGPGLLESVYEECLCRELTARNLPFERQREFPIVYKGLPANATYRIDILVDGKVILELKSVESLLRVHESQLLTYMKLADIGLGLLMNFNVPLLKDGIRRFVI
jgi:GxxExxY protein